VGLGANRTFTEEFDIKIDEEIKQ